MVLFRLGGSFCVPSMWVSGFSEAKRREVKGREGKREEKRFLIEREEAGKGKGKGKRGSQMGQLTGPSIHSFSDCSAAAHLTVPEPELAQQAVDGGGRWVSVLLLSSFPGRYRYGYGYGI